MTSIWNFILRRQRQLARKLMVPLVALVAAMALSGVKAEAQQRNFRSSDRMVLTYLFCWYDIYSYEQIVGKNNNDYLSIHPTQTSWFDKNPNYYQRKPPRIDGLPPFSYREPSWFAQQLQLMQYASIDVAAVDFWPNTEHLSRSTIGATNLNVALNSMSGNSPAVCMFLETSLFLKNTNLATEQGAEKLFRGIVEFYSRIDQRHWLTVNGEVPVILYEANVAGLNITESGMNRVREKFKAWSGKPLCFFGNETWRSRARGAIRYSCAWGAANRSDRLIAEKDLMELSPGMNYRGSTGNAPRSVDGYRAAWEAARRSNRNWVAIETFSEFIEGTAIAPTLEDGNAFLNITQSQGRRFKNRN